jgi:8-oxo-dGTP pyrophosphatase MutT (NUDIX family)
MKKERDIEILARAVCIRAGKLLVCHCKGATNTYLPGGHVESGEGAKQAVCREIMEEMGKRAVVKRFLGCVEHAFVQRGERHVEVNLVFEVAIDAITVARDPASREDYIEFHWLPLRELKLSTLEPWSLRAHLPGWLRAGGAGRWSSTMVGK